MHRIVQLNIALVHFLVVSSHLKGVFKYIGPSLAVFLFARLPSISEGALPRQHWKDCTCIVKKNYGSLSVMYVLKKYFQRNIFCTFFSI